MDIKTLEIKNLDARCICHSRFYTAPLMTKDNYTYAFKPGLNILGGDPDEGYWSISYALPMMKFSPKDFYIFSEPDIYVNNEKISFDEISKISCYLDECYPLYNKRKTVRHMVEQGIKKYNIKYTPENIRDTFHIDKERFERKLSEVGNELFWCMAAIAYVNKKRIFCFPWLSKKMFTYYRIRLLDLFSTLENLNMIIIFPTSMEDSKAYDKKYINIKFGFETYPEIDRILDMMSVKNDNTVQINGIEEAKKIWYIDSLIMPEGKEDSWENCAKVLISKNDDELQCILISLFKWLQNMERPGAKLIFDRLKRFPMQSIKMEYDICLSIAERTGDYDWKNVLKDFVST